MPARQRPRASKSWAYAYQLDPPQPEQRFAKVKTLLRRARKAAQRDGRLWTGQIVTDAHITHILVVTDAPDHCRAVDRAIDAELRRLKMAFAITRPVRVPVRRPTPDSRAPQTPARSGGRSRRT
jgi:hypothetical protein